MSGRSYREFQTSATSGWVEAFWSSTSGGHEGQRILPDGCIDFVFELDSGRARVVGTMSASQIVRSRPGTRRFGVRFCPGAASALIEPAAWELTDLDADLHDASRGARAHGLAEQIADADGDAERARLVADYLQARVGRVRPRDSRVLRVVSRLRASHGEGSIAALAAGAGVSDRQLERLFHEHVGARPKLFARVLRMQRALAALELGRGSQAAQAHAARFADEAHLVREFRALTGLTPQALLRERRVGFVQEPVAAE